MHRLVTLFSLCFLPAVLAAQTWTLQTSGTAAVLADVYFISATTGFAVADGGLLLSTNDGGATWSSQIIGGGGLDFEGIDFTSSGINGIIATDGGPVYRSTDSGATWNLVSTGAGDLRHVDWVDESVVWVAGRDGDSAVSTDAGATWTYHNTSSADRTESIAAVSATEAWIANRSGEIRHTTDGGVSWTTQSSGTGSDMKDIQMLDATSGYIAGNGNVVLKTTNGGASWTDVATAGVSGNGLFFVDANTGWVVADAGQIWFTSDGGAAWALQPSGTTHSFNRVHFPTAEDGWAVGDAGTIVHFYSGATATEPDADLPSGYVLSRIYPNPFNPQARFTLEVAETQSVRVAIFDALGRQMRILHDGVISAGSTDFVIDGSGLPSGLYLLRVTGERLTTSQSLTLLR
ncbi:MAG: T9SS type A sorting domain-containing protein [Bacteroidetes bacterium]|nr:T9SS type A sorting domain-containing protein [Bacteroidota bacterium]